MSEDFHRYLDPAVLNKVSGLELQARLVVEGFISGRHESPFKGSSVEFAEHRQYVPGDDIRHLDWKVFAKSDRFYIKEYEEETNLKAYVVVDVSKSMAYAGEGGISKLEYAKFVGASILHLVQRQQDAAALVTFNEGVQEFLPPASSGAHIRNCTKALSQAQPGGDTELGPILHEIADRLRSRSLVVLLSDFFDESGSVLEGLAHMGWRGHDVIAFHVLDHDELHLPFDRMTRFEGLEIDEHLLLDPKALREAYLEEMRSFQTEIKSACLRGRMDYVVLDTSAPLGIALSTYLAQRSQGR